MDADELGEVANTSLGDGSLLTSPSSSTLVTPTPVSKKRVKGESGDVGKTKKKQQRVSKGKTNGKDTPIKKKSPKQKSRSNGTASKHSGGGGGREKAYDNAIFTSHRIRNIMRSQNDIQNIQQDSSFLVAKAVELFIEHLVKASAAQATGTAGLTNGSTTNGNCKSHPDTIVNYEHVARVVKDADNLAFLKDFVPFKIKAADYFANCKQSSSNAAATSTLSLFHSYSEMRPPSTGS